MQLHLLYVVLFNSFLFFAFLKPLFGVCFVVFRFCFHYFVFWFFWFSFFFSFVGCLEQIKGKLPNFLSLVYIIPYRICSLLLLLLLLLLLFIIIIIIIIIINFLGRSTTITLKASSTLRRLAKKSIVLLVNTPNTFNSVCISTYNIHRCKQTDMHKK